MTRRRPVVRESVADHAARLGVQLPGAEPVAKPVPAPRRRRQPSPPPPCGTAAAYQRHIRAGETPDDACRKANAAAKVDRRLRDPAVAENHRERGRAWSRAITRLCQLHSDDWRRLLAEENAARRPSAPGPAPDENPRRFV